MFIFFPFITLLLWLTNCPAFKKILSTGTDDAMTPRYFLASLLRQGNVCSFFFHQSNGSRSHGITFSSENCRISIKTSVPVVRCCWDASTWVSNSAHFLFHLLLQYINTKIIRSIAYDRKHFKNFSINPSTPNFRTQECCNPVHHVEGFCWCVTSVHQFFQM